MPAVANGFRSQLTLLFTAGLIGEVRRGTDEQGSDEFNFVGDNTIVDITNVSDPDQNHKLQTSRINHALVDLGYTSSYKTTFTGSSRVIFPKNIGAGKMSFVSTQITGTVGQAGEPHTLVITTLSPLVE